LALLISGAAAAQDGKGWLGADVHDVTKAEADKLKWDAPHGAKVGVVASGSPAEKAGLKSGDIVLSINNVEPETSADLEKAIEGQNPGAEVKLRVLSGGRESRVSVALGERPKVREVQQQALPHLMLDTGGHTAAIWGMVFTPDGKQLVSGADDKVIRNWDWQKATTIRTIRGQVGQGLDGRISAIALSPDGHWLAAGVDDQDIRLYDFATGDLAALLLKGHSGGSSVAGLAFSPDSRRLISGSTDHTAIIWDVEGHQLVHRLLGHGNQIYAVAFTPDGERAVTASYDTTLRLWRVSDGGLIAEMKGHAKFIQRALAVRSRDSLIASGDATGEIRLWDGNTGQYLRTLAHKGGQVGSLRFSPDGKWLLSTCGLNVNGNCEWTQRIWEVDSGILHVTYSNHNNTAYASAVSPDGHVVATAAYTGGIHVWDPETGKTEHVLAGTGKELEVGRLFY
jgi:WD40 repeat protein